MHYKIVPLTEKYSEGYNAPLDSVARERKYISLVEAPPLEKSRTFVQANLQKGNPQYVALVDGVVVGWCEIIRNERLVFRQTIPSGPKIIYP